MFAVLAKKEYKDSTEKIYLVQYLRAMHGIETKQLTLDSYKELIALARQGYPGAGDSLYIAENVLYNRAIKEYRYKDNYRSGYVEAHSIFKYLNGYKDSRKYITLIEGRTEYNYLLNKDSSFSRKKAILNDIISIIEFEDAAEVLVSSHNIAVDFLEGMWRDRTGRYYFSMSSEHNASYNLPFFNYGDYYRIEDGIYELYPKGKETLARSMYRFTVVSPSRIRVYCYQDRNTYELFRQ